MVVQKALSRSISSLRAMTSTLHRQSPSSWLSLRSSPAPSSSSAIRSDTSFLKPLASFLASQAAPLLPRLSASYLRRISNARCSSTLISLILELPQEFKVAGLEVADVLYVVLEHHQAVDAEAPGEAAVFYRIDFGFFKHVRVDHAAAAELDPTRV